MLNDIDAIKRGECHYIYTHAGPDGQVFYVGKGRWRRAWSFVRRNDLHQARVATCGGRDKIKVTVYPMVDERHALSLEEEMIRRMRYAGFELCNKVPGGHGKGRVITPEHREKLRTALKGHAVSPETRARIGAAGVGRPKAPSTLAKQRGRKLSEAHKLALLKAITGRPVSEESRAKSRAKMQGRKLSEEHRRKLSAAHKGVKQSPELVAKRAAAVRAACAARRAAKEGGDANAV